MSFKTNLVCNIHDLAESTTDPKTKKQLLNLWKNVCNYQRAEEAIHCSGIHTPETIAQSKNELSKISSSWDLLSNVILENN
jgi:hypothetical protein